jgi:fucose 4-O-acetylase-like acetyltransferase
MERQTWLDRAKGFGIALVAYGHVMRGMVAAGVVANDPVERAIDYTLYTFHMPLFFFLAGLNAERSLGHGARRFLINKLHYVLWPYVLWSLIEGLVHMRFTGSVNGALTYDDLLQIGWRPFGQFWFLYDQIGRAHV